ncbi:MAG: hypothetical protein AAB817_02745 [Patescibacteria group bacterium]
MPGLLFWALVAAIVAITNDFTSHSLLLGGLAGGVYLGCLIRWHGRWLAREQTLAWRWIIGALAALVWFAGVGAVVYIVIGLSVPVVYGLLVAWPLLAALVAAQRPTTDWIQKILTWLRRVSWWLTWRQRMNHAISQTIDWATASPLTTGGVCLWLLSIGFAWLTLLTHPTTTSINSLWQALPIYFLISYAASILLLVWLWSRDLPPWLYPVMSYLTVGVVAATAVLVYRTGYGFDPFIHRATETVIWQRGAITPKTPYYLGQYSTVVMLARLFGASIDIVDRILVPLTATLLLPLTAMATVRSLVQQQTFKWGRHLLALPATWWLAIIPLLLVFLDQTIVTTPQSLANIWAMVVIGLAYVGYHHRSAARWWLLPLASSAAISLIHPLTGLPLTLFVAWLAVMVSQWPLAWRRVGVVAIALLGVISLLASFALAVWLAPQVGTNFTAAFLNISWPRFDWPLTLPKQTFHLWADLAQAARWWPLVASTGLAVAGWQLISHRRAHPAIAWVMVILINAGLVYGFVDFSAVINYEQSAYAIRIAATALLYLWPLMSVGAVAAVTVLRRQRATLQITAAGVLVLLAAVHYYAIFPHDDIHTIGHAYSPGPADVAAVRQIEQLAGGEPYVVLANQAVAAVAMQEFGFRYYPTSAGELFFYPIPTAGPLYQFYLTAINSGPSRALMTDAMNTVGVQRSYLVVNHYWTAAADLIAAAKLTADGWQDIDGQVTIFEYR